MDTRELTTAYNNLMRTNTTTVDRQSYEEDVELLYKHALEQEPKTGYWTSWYEIIEHEWGTEHDPHCKCSECSTEIDPHTSKFINYCPICGAKIVGYRKREET